MGISGLLRRRFLYIILIRTSQNPFLYVVALSPVPRATSSILIRALEIEELPHNASGFWYGALSPHPGGAVQLLLLGVAIELHYAISRFCDLCFPPSSPSTCAVGHLAVGEGNSWGGARKDVG